MVQANKTMVRVPPNYPSTMVQIEKAVGHRFYVTTDAHSQFSSFPLKEGPTRDSCAVWTPSYGIIRPKRLIFGHVNAPSYAQGAYRKFQHEDLSKDTQDHHVYFQDDASLFPGKDDGPIKIGRAHV